MRTGPTTGSTGAPLDSQAANTSGGAAGGAAGAPPPSGTPSPARKWSLQREWSTAFILMLVALLLGAAVTIFGVRAVMNQMEATAKRLAVQSDSISKVLDAVESHEQVAYQLLVDAPVDRTAFILQQREISNQFDAAAAVLPAENGMRSTLQQARQDWQAGLTARGLWEDQVQSLRGNHVAETPALAASSSDVRRLLADVQRASVKALDQGLVDTRDLEQLLIVGRIALFVVAIAATLYFGQRIVKDLILPVNNLRRGVLTLQAGDYTHRIEVARNDELGELATAFNGMATTLENSHLALTHRATHDPLTGLANRAALTERLAAASGPDSSPRHRHDGLLFIDVDNFKAVNDTLGHEQGDELLIQLGARLKSCVRTHDLVARVGGDEFAIVVMDTEDDTSATLAVAKRIHDALRTPFSVGEGRLTVTVSMGVAQRGPETGDAIEMLRQADIAMYAAKHGGKARYELYNAKGNNQKAYNAALTAELTAAVAAGQQRQDAYPGG